MRDMRIADFCDWPDFDSAKLQEMRQFGLKMMLVRCIESDATSDGEEGEPAAVSFYVFADFVPRVDELVTLEDGKTCKVAELRHVVRTSDSGTPIMLTVISAVWDNRIDGLGPR